MCCTFCTKRRAKEKKHKRIFYKWVEADRGTLMPCSRVKHSSQTLRPHWNTVSMHHSPMNRYMAIRSHAWERRYIPHTRRIITPPATCSSSHSRWMSIHHTKIKLHNYKVQAKDNYHYPTDVLVRRFGTLALQMCLRLLHTLLFRGQHLSGS
jgi:hypothetical protein